MSARETAIHVEGLGKRYALGETHGDLLAEKLAAGLRWAARAITRRPRPRASEGAGASAPGLRAEEIGGSTAAGADHIWACRDVSLDVRRGEVLGIIGRNGAGKSTLLKILTGITEPTEGTAWIRGRVGSLLEVGTGFHPELTGRENIFLNGAILGMRRAEVRAKFDDIVEFSGVRKFIDTPVKRYSSGMYVRLAFAVAAHLQPEVLLIDEVLAVGDASFQKKCLGKMHEAAQGGRTVLFVSHNMAAVQNLCTRAVWLEQGAVAADGAPHAVVSQYLNASLAAGSETERRWDDVATAPGSEAVRLRRVSVRPEDGTPSDAITIRTPVVVEFDYWCLSPGRKLNLSLQLTNEAESVVFATAPTEEPVWHGRPFPRGLFRSVCRIPGDLLNEGAHRACLQVVEDTSIVLSRHEDILVFDVRDALDMRGNYYGKWPGAVRPRLDWTTQLLEEGAPV